MKRKAVLVAVLVVLLLSLVVAGTGRAAEITIGPNFRDAFEDYVVLEYLYPCPEGCLGRPGYTIGLGYGDDRASCRYGEHVRPVSPNMASTPRLVFWGEDHPEPGDTACVFWCCYFNGHQLYQWLYAEVKGEPGTW